MDNQVSFLVYNASAGSGKTYLLVKEYLKTLLQATTNYKFKNILAVTFTNKAVNEMKQRIIANLTQFSNLNSIDNPSDMFSDICEELKIKPITVQQKSKAILSVILHNYAAFNITTIDSFNHKLIRTFAYDLKLPLNFEVELDTDTLLNQAVDRLIAKAGTNKTLTKTLVDFALEKADDDKSWDVSRDFNTVAKHLLKENDLEYIKTIQNKTFEDFDALKKQLLIRINTTKKTITNTAKNILALITEKGVDYHDFLRTTIPNHFIKAKDLSLNTLYNSNIEENLANRKNIYTKTLAVEKASIIDAIIPEIAIAYHNIKKAVYDYKFLKLLYKNSTPLSVLKSINNELLAIKTEENKVLISEFNKIISEEIKQQPTPFIYERIGEKFRHYFIDEFQDTSKVQWENLIPLIDNTLSSENLKGEKGTALLVGDAKQAIYRWRGGKAQQFINLYNKTTTPFYVKQKVESLDYNYRSCKSIVNFNNTFFKYIAGFVFSKKEYASLYDASHQKAVKEEEGYVSLHFLDPQKEDNIDELYTQQVLKTINNCLSNGYQAKDICILVRKKKHGVIIANYLNEKNISISSNETMLINNSLEVQLINNILTILINPNNKEAKIEVLEFIAQKHKINEKHSFYKTHINLQQEALFKKLQTGFNININPTTIVQETLFNIVETIIRAFNLVETSNAYIQYYMDVVLEFSNKNSSDISSFLEYFNAKKETLSIVSPAMQNAIQIITIHKSKGLEFPVVIFPYANSKIYEEIEPKEWVQINPEKHQGFTHTLVNYNKDFEYFNENTHKIYNNHQAELELDSINLLYVALTRAIEQLYIIGKKEINKKGETNLKTYSGLLIQYLKHKNEWEPEKIEYNYGNYNKVSISEKNQNTIKQESFITTAQKNDLKIITNSGQIWNTKQQVAIERGNLIHDIMQYIKTQSDVDYAINTFLTKSIINKQQTITIKKSILKIINHPELKAYYSSKNKVYNERDIISQSGKTFRPDRLVINTKNEAIIIDYKTGLPNPKYKYQLQDYQDVLMQMNIKTTSKKLVYINDTIKVIEC